MDETISNQTKAQKCLLHLKQHYEELCKPNPKVDHMLNEYRILHNQTNGFHSRNVQAASIELNTMKNRYRNILPYDNTRVKLSEFPGVKYSDYVNANYVKGAFSEKEYIASQAPLPCTLSDFWRMIWEQDVKVVVMACNLTEGPKQTVKCERYWPAEEGESMIFGDITVCLKSAERQCGGNFITRELEMLFNGVPRTVMQYHYISWPDHGIPMNVSPLLTMITFIRRYQPNSEHLIVVHCSAGVGRTGTIIAIDYIWNLLKTGLINETISVPNIVAEMRKQRMRLVQTMEQYEFLYRCVLFILIDLVPSDPDFYITLCQRGMVCSGIILEEAVSPPVTTNVTDPCAQDDAQVCTVRPKKKGIVRSNTFNFLKKRKKEDKSNQADCMNNQQADKPSSSSLLQRLQHRVSSVMLKYGNKSKQPMSSAKPATSVTNLNNPSHSTPSQSRVAVNQNGSLSNGQSSTVLHQDNQDRQRNTSHPNTSLDPTPRQEQSTKSSEQSTKSSEQSTKSSEQSAISSQQSAISSGCDKNQACADSSVVCATVSQKAPICAIVSKQPAVAQVKEFPNLRHVRSHSFLQCEVGNEFTSKDDELLINPKNFTPCKNELTDQTASLAHCSDVNMQTVKSNSKSSTHDSSDDGLDDEDSLGSYTVEYQERRCCELSSVSLDDDSTSLGFQCGLILDDAACIGSVAGETLFSFPATACEKIDEPSSQNDAQVKEDVGCSLSSLNSYTEEDDSELSASVTDHSTNHQNYCSFADDFYQKIYVS